MNQNLIKQKFPQHGQKIDNAFNMAKQLTNGKTPNEIVQILKGQGLSSKSIDDIYNTYGKNPIVNTLSGMMGFNAKDLKDKAHELFDEKPLDTSNNSTDYPRLT